MALPNWVTAQYPDWYDEDDIATEGIEVDDPVADAAEAEAQEEYEARLKGKPTFYSPTPGGPNYIPMFPVNNPSFPFGGTPTGGGGGTTTPTTTNSPSSNRPQTYWGDDGYEYAWDSITGKPVRTGSYDPNKDKIGQQDRDRAERDRQTVLEQERIRAEQEKQQRLAQLRANPASWVEYAALAGTTPQIQPWMLPLMPQQYSQFKTGQDLPGWTAGGSSLSSLPDLTDPSAQYMARLNPAQREQYYGYEQARTGARAEDTRNVLWNQAPPSGTNQGLRWMR